MANEKIDPAVSLKNQLLQQYELPITQIQRKVRVLHENERLTVLHFKTDVVDAMMSSFFETLTMFSKLYSSVGTSVRGMAEATESMAKIDTLSARDAIPIILEQVYQNCGALLDEIMDMVPEYERIELPVTTGEDWLRKKIAEWSEELNKSPLSPQKYTRFVQQRISKYQRMLSDRTTSLDPEDSPGSQASTKKRPLSAEENTAPSPKRPRARKPAANEFIKCCNEFWDHYANFTDGEIISNEGRPMEQLEDIVRRAIEACMFSKTCSFDTFFGPNSRFGASPAWIDRYQREIDAKNFLKQELMGAGLPSEDGNDDTYSWGASLASERLPCRELDTSDTPPKMELRGGTTATTTTDPRCFEFYHPENFIRGLCAAGNLPVPSSLQTANMPARPLRSDWNCLRERKLDNAVAEFIESPDKSSLWDNHSEGIRVRRSQAKSDFPSGYPIPAWSAAELGRAVRDARASFILAALSCWDNCTKGKCVDAAKKDRLTAEHRRCSALVHYEEMRKLGDQFELDGGNRPWREREALYGQSVAKTDFLYSESEKAASKRDDRIVIAWDKMENSNNIKSDRGLLAALPWPYKQPEAPSAPPRDDSIQGIRGMLQEEMERESGKASPDVAKIRALQDMINPQRNVPAKRTMTRDGERIQTEQPRRRRLSLSQLTIPGALPGQPPVPDPVRIITCPGFTPFGMTRISDPDMTSRDETEAAGEDNNARGKRGNGDTGGHHKGGTGGGTGARTVPWPSGRAKNLADNQFEALFKMFDVTTSKGLLRGQLQHPGKMGHAKSGSQRLVAPSSTELM